MLHFIFNVFDPLPTLSQVTISYSPSLYYHMTQFPIPHHCFMPCYANHNVWCHTSSYPSLTLVTNCHSFANPFFSWSRDIICIWPILNSALQFAFNERPRWSWQRRVTSSSLDPIEESPRKVSNLFFKTPLHVGYWSFML